MTDSRKKEKLILSCGLIFDNDEKLILHKEGKCFEFDWEKG